MSLAQEIKNSNLKNKEYIKSFSGQNKLYKKYIQNLDSKKDNSNCLKNKSSNNNNNSSLSINLETIEKIINKYIQNKKGYINNIIDSKVISNYLYSSKKLESFIHLNELTINDFIPIVFNSKIIICQNDNCLFKEGDESFGFYALLKGSLKVKVSKFNSIMEINPNYRDEILKEYNLEIYDVNWINNKKDNKINKNSDKNNLVHMNSRKSSILNYDINFKSKRYSLRNNLISFSRKSINKLNNEYSREKELFIYNSKNYLYLNKEINETLIFGGVNLFNDYMTDTPQIHLSSAYCYSKEKNNNYANENILLFFRNESLKNLKEKIIIKNKERINFLSKKLLPIKNLPKFDFSFFLSNIKLIYIHINQKKDITISNNNIIYLIYKGQCFFDDLNKNKNIIYDEGDFLFLNNIFENNNGHGNKIISIYTKSSNSIIFQIDLDVLSNDNLINMKIFLRNIYEKQNNIRFNYYINNINYILNKENQKEKNNKKYYIVSSKKLMQFPQNHSKNNNNNVKFFRNASQNNIRNKKLDSFIICTYNKNPNEKSIFKKYYSPNLVKIKLTKFNSNKLLTIKNMNQKYSINYNNKILFENKSTDFKNNISTKNSTNYNIKKEFIINNSNSNIIPNNSVNNISLFNGNTSKLKEESVDRNKKSIKLFKNNLFKNRNIISSIIPKKHNIISRNPNEINEYFYLNKYKSSNITQNYFNKKIFLKRNNKNTNILKYFYEKDSKIEESIKNNDRKNISNSKII